jgi:hypothetical protein
MPEERVVLEKVRMVVDRALEDPEFEQRLSEDPWGTAETVGLSREEAVTALGLEPESSDRDIGEVLRDRVTQTNWGRGLPDEILDRIP